MFRPLHLLIEFNVHSSEEAIIKFNKISSDFDIFMQSKKDFGKTIYYFSAITEESDLLNAPYPFSPATFVQILPKFWDITPSASKSVGFLAKKREKSKRSITLPSLMMSEI